ncbi:MAG: cell division protein FtsZ [Tannerella sp.]|nr:cell division protein FtsZ [Tannerella sp.]
MDDKKFDIITGIKIPRNPTAIIKVIGVGGGGGNAVTNMYKEGIQDVSFALINTDRQALKNSPVPVKLAIAELGAGNDPKKGRAQAEEHKAEISALLQDGTEMVFITAGMGGGTGTGAAPVIAQIAKDMGILTIGIVTIPFLYEGDWKINQALDGVEEMSKQVDALLVINNERLREVYADMTILNAYKKADDTLLIAARSIAEIVTVPGYVNVDFADVNTTLKNGGVAFISIGYGEGDRRVEQAIENALHSPLWHNNDIRNAQKLLFNITHGSAENEPTLRETEHIENFMRRFNKYIQVKNGFVLDESLGEKVKFTILASGFGLNDLEMYIEQERKEGEELDERKEKFYGPGKGGLVGKHIQPVSWGNISLLEPDELDNEAIIKIFEDYPAYNRDRKYLKMAREKSL